MSRIRNHIPQAHGRRQMDLIASVSRSSGLEKGGDAWVSITLGVLDDNGDQFYSLKDFKIQEEYRKFIQEKLDDYWKLHSEAPDADESEANKRHRRAIEDNILILFRKLREGIVSSKRNDDFALEVYEISLCLSAIFESSKQATAIASYLIPDFYDRSRVRQPNVIPVVLVSLLHHLVLHYPAQGHFHEHLQVVSPSLLPRSCEAYQWITSLAASIRSHNYIRFEKISRSVSWDHVWTTADREASGYGMTTLQAGSRDLLKEAVAVLIDSLRSKFRDAIWKVLQSSYRELSCHSGSETRAWLTTCLALRSVRGDARSISVDAWVEWKRGEGQLRAKESVEGRWIICKVL